MTEEVYDMLEGYVLFISTVIHATGNSPLLSPVQTCPQSFIQA